MCLRFELTLKRVTVMFEVVVMKVVIPTVVGAFVTSNRIWSYAINSVGCSICSVMTTGFTKSVVFGRTSHFSAPIGTV